MTEKLILEKLGNLEKHNEMMVNKVDKIESAIGLLAVQSERLDNLAEQTKALWDKYEEAFSPGKYIESMKSFQASCPRDTIKNRLKELWVAYALLATTMLTCILNGKDYVK